MHFKASTCQVLSSLLFQSSFLFLQYSWYLVDLLDVLSAQLLTLLTSYVLNLFDGVDISGKMDVIPSVHVNFYSRESCILAYKIVFVPLIWNCHPVMWLSFKTLENSDQYWSMCACIYFCIYIVWAGSKYRQDCELFDQRDNCMMY